MATRWVQEGYWGRYFLRLSEDGQFQFQIPKGAGIWRIIQVDLTPDDGGAFGTTGYTSYNLAGQAEPGAAGGAAPAPIQAPARPAPRPGAPPNARLVDILRAVNERTDVSPSPKSTDDEP